MQVIASIRRTSLRGAVVTVLLALLATLGLVGPNPQSASAAMKQTISLKSIKNEKIYQGQKTSFWGKTNVSKGKLVQLQVKRGSKWAVVAKTRVVKSRKGYNYIVRFSAPQRNGMYTYRARVLTRSAKVAATSRPKTIKVVTSPKRVRAALSNANPYSYFNIGAGRTLAALLNSNGQAVEAWWDLRPSQPGWEAVSFDYNGDGFMESAKMDENGVPGFDLWRWDTNWNLDDGYEGYYLPLADGSWDVSNPIVPGDGVNPIAAGFGLFAIRFGGSPVPCISGVNCPF